MTASQLALRYALQIIAVVVVWFVYRAARYGRRERDLPPGPPTAFGIGNLHLMPRKDAYLKMSQWAREYGEVYSLKVGHQTIIVINSPEAVQQIMEKGNAYTQGRPFIWLITQYMYQHDHLIFTDMPSKVSSFRRAYSAMLNSRALLEYISIQEAESAQLLYDILTAPNSFFDAIRRFTFSVILSITFGMRAPRFESPSVRMFYDYLGGLTHLMSVGSTPPLDLIPALRLIPGRFASWKRLASKVASKERELTGELIQGVKNRIATGSNNGSFVEGMFQKRDSFSMTENMVQMFGGEALSGASETTASFLLSAVLMLVGEEDVQARAHEELDRVVGQHRMPVLSDIPDLPYVRAIVREIERLRPVIPLGIPHRATADQVYAGHRIPNDATILINSWAMGHDPKLFDEAEKFWPERFLSEEAAVNAKGEEVPIFTFGFGRRICPGMGLAKNTVSIVMARLLWAFNISKSIEPSTGKLVEVDKMSYADTISLCPNKFRCDIRARSPAHAEAIRSEWHDAIPQLQRFEGRLSADDAVFVEKQRCT